MTSPPAVELADRRGRPRALPMVPLLLALLAAWDLREELRLMLDHPTLTAFSYLIRSHPLAMVVLLLQPSLWKRYG
ncbi:MAG: hypothetical protein VKM34_11585 [Cyanobacteriota bacterium]|nr:hypothetical protein [Cyanobacteriota bacterium]